MKNPRLTEGMAKILATEADDVPQIKIGTRLIDMPGARIRSVVSTKFIAPNVVRQPRA